MGQAAFGAGSTRREDVRAESYRRLESARLVGAAAVAILALLGVGPPPGLPQSLSRPAVFVTAYAAALLVLGGIALYLRLGGRRGAAIFTLAVVSLHVALLIPTLAESPIVAGGAVIWQLALAGGVLLPLRLPARADERTRPREFSPVERWVAKTGAAARHITLVSLVVTVAAVGFGIGDRIPARTVCLTLDVLAFVLAVPLIRLLVRDGSRLAWLPLFPVLATTLAWGRPDAALTLLATSQLVVLGLLLPRMATFAELLSHFWVRPAVLIAVSFAALIAAGTLLLSFPAASTTGRPIAPIDALFTATSAVCVTGLTVLDTARDFTTFGHIVILALIQIGGLNIMVLSAFAALILGRSLGLRQERALGEVLDVRRAGGRLIAFIVLATAAIELIGAALLTLAYVGRGYTLGAAGWHGVFHAVSAFCNAGFSLHSNNLIPFQTHAPYLFVVATLIVLGGLGFPVLAHPLFSRGSRRDTDARVQSRIVVTATVALIVVGAVWFAALEWERSLAGLDTGDKLVNALFQSITPRTAGFNSIDYLHLGSATVLLTMAWMFIGASPGGTGGGIKTTTAVVLLSTLVAMARGERKVVLYRRALTVETVQRSVAITVVAVLVVVLGSVLLQATHTLPFERLMFEVVSAFGTVGLSIGVSPQLDGLGRFVIVLIMFIGRIGPVTLALLFGRRRLARLEYPEARIMVG